MRTRKAVITIAFAAALGVPVAAAAPALAAPATVSVAAAHAPYVGHNVGGGLLTRQSLHVGQVINFVGSTGGAGAS